MLLLVFPFALFGPSVAPLLYACYMLSLQVLLAHNIARTSYACMINYFECRRDARTDWYQRYLDETGKSNKSASGDSVRLTLNSNVSFESVAHVIVLPNYKEEMATLCETLDVLASHSIAATQYRICLAMEESETNSHLKAHKLIEKYGDSFADITYTVHPVGLHGEIRGKSSNVSWAVREMARRYAQNSADSIHGSLQGNEIITIMDADTCFAEDYFSATTYYYCVASAEERSRMMFAPFTLFDRNSNNVPGLVRITDFLWSLAVMSNNYQSSMIKFPCSAYSLSMKLACQVGFWDVGPEAIGEDMHMYLKCFFKTKGHLIVRTIHSPASQCNVASDIQSTGSWIAYVDGVYARYVQAKRHLWGSLDYGYTLRSFIVAVLRQATGRTADEQKGKSEASQWNWPRLTMLLVRIFEAHVLTSQCFIMIPFSIIYHRTDPYTIMSSLGVASVLTGFVGLLLPMLTVVQAVANVMVVYFYERYHQFAGVERWRIQRQIIENQNAAQAQSYLCNVETTTTVKRHDSARYINELSEYHAERQYEVAASKLLLQDPHSDLHIHHLGQRSQLQSSRALPWCLLDWILLPVAGFLYFFVPLIHAQISHLFTDSLDYKVAGKPLLKAIVHASTSTLPAAVLAAASGSGSSGGPVVSEVVDVRVERRIIVLDNNSLSESDKQPRQQSTGKSISGEPVLSSLKPKVEIPSSSNSSYLAISKPAALPLTPISANVLPNYLDVNSKDGEESGRDEGYFEDDSVNGSDRDYETFKTTV